MRVTKIITWLLVCAFLISGCAKNENADSAAEPGRKCAGRLSGRNGTGAK